MKYTSLLITKFQFVGNNICIIQTFLKELTDCIFSLATLIQTTMIYIENLYEQVVLEGKTTEVCVRIASCINKLRA